MSYETPLLRTEKRESRPTSVFGRFHGQGNLGMGLGLKGHGMSNFPKVGVNVTPKNQVTGMGIKPIKSFAEGGLNTDTMNVNSQMPSNIPLNEFYPSDNSVSQGIQGGISPYSLGDVSMAQPAQQDPSIGKPYQGSLAITNPQQQGGFKGWMDNPQFGGITGKQYVNAGLTALTGILSNIANGKLTQSAGNIISNANRNSNMGAVMPTHTTVRRASGGIIPSYCCGGEYASGGMTGDMYQDGSQTNQQSTQQSTQPDANNPQSQMITANCIKALLGQSQNPQQDVAQFVQHFGPDALQALVQQVKQSQGGQGQSGIAGAAPNGPSGAAMQPAPSNGQGMASQGISSGMASGGMTGSRDGNGLLSGDGGGMDDQILSNDSQVRVADSEFVIPADSVAMLGDGSVKEGARKLTEGISRLRKAKYGRDKQPPRLGPNKNPILG